LLKQFDFFNQNNTLWLKSAYHDVNYNTVRELIMGEIKVGEKIKEFREKKNMSLHELAEKTGFSSAFISQIENHLISPPLGAIIKIAHALSTEMGRFFGQTTSAPFTLVRSNERELTSRVASKEGVRYGYTYESLAPEKINRHMEPFIVTLEPVQGGQPYSHEGEEFIYVLEGEVKIQLADYSDILYPGDCIYYDSIVPHRVDTATENSAKILAVLYSS
jgi:transcriptional regulator with XRE-family HTH domain